MTVVPLVVVKKDKPGDLEERALADLRRGGSGYQKGKN
jgi:hypothetical protein